MKKRNALGLTLLLATVLVGLYGPAYTGESQTIIKREEPVSGRRVVVVDAGLSNNAERIQQAFDATAAFNEIVILGTGTCLLEHDLNIPRPMYVRCNAPNLTLKFADSITHSYGATGADSAGQHPHYIAMFTLGSAAAGSKLDLHCIVDTNWDNTYAENYSGDLDLLPLPVLAIECDGLEWWGTEIINDRNGGFIIDSDRVYLHDLYWHDAASTADVSGLSAMSIEGCYDFTMERFYGYGIWEPIDANNTCKDIKLIDCHFTAVAGEVDCALESNDSPGWIIRDCTFENLGIWLTLASVARLSQRTSVDDFDAGNYFVMDNVVQTYTVAPTRAWFETQARPVEGLDITNWLVKADYAPSGVAAIYIYDKSNDNDAIHKASIDLKIYAPSVAFTTKLFDIGPTAVDLNIRLNGQIGNTSTNLITMGKVRSATIGGSLYTGTIGATPITISNVEGVVDASDFLLMPLSGAVNYPMLTASGAGVAKAAAWHAVDGLGTTQGLINGTDSAYTPSTFVPYATNYLDPDLWIRDGATELISSTSLTNTGTVTQGPPGMTLPWPCRSLYFGTSTSYSHAGNNGDVTSGDFWVAAVFGGIGSLGTDGAGIVTKGQLGSHARYEIYVRNLNSNGFRGTVGGYISNGTTNVSLSAANDTLRVDEGAAHLVVLTRVGSTVYLYLDNANLIASNAGASGINLTNSDNFVIGARTNSGGGTGYYLGQWGTGVYVSQPMVVNGNGLSSTDVSRLWHVLMGAQLQ